MTLGSLLAGIGGFDLGFERAGFETVWQVEINDYCRRVLERHFPRAERFGDIRECGAHNLKPVDVICGGFPCQDISVAGKRVGIGGERSGLWSEYARIICDLRPKFVVVENVAALLNRGMERVVGDLAAAGYDCEWCVISAADMGAAHLRERVWIVAYPVRDGRNGGGCTQGNIFPPQRPTESAEQFWDRWFYRAGKVGEALEREELLDWRVGSGNRKKLYEMLGEEEGKKMGCQSLNPYWVEWLMGYPIGWTALEDSETQ